MKYILVQPDGSIGRSWDFDIPPVIPANKGKWLPDTPPTFDPKTHQLVRNPVQSVNAAEIAYTISARDLSTVRNEKLAEFEHMRKVAQEQDVTVQGKVFPANGEYREVISNLASRSGRGKPLPGSLRGKNGQSVTLNPTLLGQIEDTIAAQVQAAWDKYWLKYDLVQAASTVETINSVTW